MSPSGNSIAGVAGPCQEFFREKYPDLSLLLPSDFLPLSLIDLIQPEASSEVVWEINLQGSASRGPGQRGAENGLGGWQTENHQATSPYSFLFFFSF